jgi:host cell factor
LTGASLVIFGGHFYEGQETGFKYLNDTYVLDVNSSRWIKPKISGTPPPPRYGHSSILAGSRIIIFGGKGSKTTFRDLHALDPVTMTWYQGPEGGGAPSARFDHSSNLVGGTKMIVFGGWNG